MIASIRLISVSKTLVMTSLTCVSMTIQCSLHISQIHISRNSIIH